MTMNVHLDCERVALLTGGEDRSYAIGLTTSLVARGVTIEFVGSDKVDGPELHGNPMIKFLNLRGDQREDVSLRTKARRLAIYYLRLLKYALVAEPRIFHILWNNKFEVFDRTVLMLYYRLCGRRIVLTAHNVNAARRDGRDSALNRMSLRAQYWLSDHIFVHTDKMKSELLREFGIAESKVSVIPFGINNTVPTTNLSSQEAKERLGLRREDFAALFFGQIAPYKGLEYLVDALPELIQWEDRFRLVIAGKVKKGCETYWQEINRRLTLLGKRECVVQRIQHIPDVDVEMYFKAADVLVVPYASIFQSGVPFLAYSFGLPVIATDVGSLRDDVLDGTTGIICRPRSPADLCSAIRAYFASDLYRQMEHTRSAIRKLANERYSWARVGEITSLVYRRLVPSE